MLLLFCKMLFLLLEMLLLFFRTQKNARKSGLEEVWVNRSHHGSSEEPPDCSVIKRKDSDVNPARYTFVIHKYSPVVSTGFTFSIYKKTRLGLQGPWRACRRRWTHDTNKMLDEKAASLEATVQAFLDAQGRYYMYMLCFNKKISYWPHTPFPGH